MGDRKGKCFCNLSISVRKNPPGVVTKTSCFLSSAEKTPIGYKNAYLRGRISDNIPETTHPENLPRWLQNLIKQTLRNRQRSLLIVERLCVTMNTKNNRRITQGRFRPQAEKARIKQLLKQREDRLNSDPPLTPYAREAIKALGLSPEDFE